MVKEMDDSDKDAEILELRQHLKVYADENKRLHLNAKKNASGGAAPRSTHLARNEIAQMQVRIDDLQKNNSHLQQSLQYKEKQLSAANAAALWAHTQLAVVVQQMQALGSDMEQIAKDRTTTPLKGRKAKRSPSPGARHGQSGQDTAQKALSDLCALVTTADQSVQALRGRFMNIDVDGKVKDLETQLRQWKTSAERQRGEVEAMENENRELRERLQNGGELFQREESATRIVSPEVIRMPSHATHSVNADHWPVRSVASQTPRGDEQWIWSVSGDRSPRRTMGTPTGSRNTSAVWDAPPQPGSTPPSPMWTSPMQAYDSPRPRRTTSPGRAKGSGLVSSAVLRRHTGSRSPFRETSRGNNAFA